jgi:small subunit ribosomal protein S13
MSYFLNQAIDGRIPVQPFLTRVLGVGFSLASCFCKDLGFRPSLRFHQLSLRQRATLGSLVLRDKQTFKQETLLRNVSERVRSLILIRCYRGQRHQMGFPCRGQRTRTNSKTAKKRKITSSSNDNQ